MDTTLLQHDSAGRCVAATSSTAQPSSRLLTALSDDILTRIVACLPVRDQQTLLRGTCRRFRRVCDSDRLWAVLCASGAIAPLPPLSWRMLGQRLSCHRWCYAAMAAEEGPAFGSELQIAGGPEFDLAAPDGEGGVAVTTADGSAQLPPFTAAPLNVPAAPPLAPAGRWLRVVQTGLRYETFPDSVLPFIDAVAASRPLSDHRGNNTASIGLIPIGLHAPREGGTTDGAEVEGYGQHTDSAGDSEALLGAARPPLPDGADPAVALHRKLFSAMGVEFTGDWSRLCEVMRPRMSPSEGSAANGRIVAGRSRSGLADDPTAPSLHIFDTMPHLGERRVMATCLSPGDAAAHPNATAKLVEALFATCSTIIFAAPSAAALAVWLDIVSPHMSLVASPSPFSTADNTPNVVFMTAEPIPSLREVLTGGDGDGMATVGAAPEGQQHRREEEIVSSESAMHSSSSLSSPPSTPSSTVAASIGLPQPQPPRRSLRRRPPKEAFSWVLNRSSCVGEVVFSDVACPLSLKTLYAAAWVAPECSLPLPAPAIARMLVAAGSADGGAFAATSAAGAAVPSALAPSLGSSVSVPVASSSSSAAASAASSSASALLWTHDVALSICAGHARQCVRFYEEAMRTEIAEANRPMIAFTRLPVPMEPSEIVSLQDHFFYAALRSYAMVVRHACGADTAAGMALLEEFKKDISTAFRRLWSANITTSRAYCTDLFDSVFLSVHSKYTCGCCTSRAADGHTGVATTDAAPLPLPLSNETVPPTSPALSSHSSPLPDSYACGCMAPGAPFSDRRVLRQWFSAVTDKISEYVIKAKGQRKMDVLCERLATRTIGGLKAFCVAHPNHPHIHLEDVAAAGAELSAYCAEQMAAYHEEQDAALSAKQRSSAMYTACLGAMWGREAVEAAIRHLTALGSECDTWAELLQLKREGFGLAPTALLSLAVVATSSAPYHPTATASGDLSKPANDGYASASASTYGDGDDASETNSVSASQHSVGGSHHSRSASAASVFGGGRSSATRASAASSNATASAASAGTTRASGTQSSGGGGGGGGGVMGMLSSFWNTTFTSPSAASHVPSASATVAASSSTPQPSAPPPRERERSSRGGGGRLSRLAARISPKNTHARSNNANNNNGATAAEKDAAALRVAVANGECVLFTELEYERQALLQDLLRRHGEHKQRMEAVGRQLSGPHSDQTAADFGVIQRQFSDGFQSYRAARRVGEAADEIATRLRTMRERVRSSFAATRGD